MFTFVHGNRQEALARHLAGRLSDAPLPLFEREIIVVQSSGMARWLQLVLAEELGLVTQLRFAFPAAWLWQLFGTVLPNVPQDSPFSRDILTWQLLRLVQTAPPATEAAAFAPLHRYLADGDIEKRHGLARKLAECFDNYLAYRPDWVGGWLAGKQHGLGEHEAWQAWLWQRIGAETGELPKAHPAELFFRALEDDAANNSSRSGQDRSAPTAPAGLGTNGCLTSRLPRRVSIFGAGAMPPPYLDIFKRLGEHIDVAFYLVNPCREHWGELVSERTRARAALETPELLESFEVGQPLLGSLGGPTRVVFERLMGNNDEDVFVEPPGNAMLASLQADLLDMKSRTPDERTLLAAADDSIQFHVCHSATREIEVLHDRLLALFEADPTLQPHDVLVLTPDIATTAPLIEAIFAGGQKTIPFTIADKPLELEAPLLRAFDALLDLQHGRFDAESVLGVLEQPHVAQRFGFDADALDMVRAWVAASGIRWGLSAEARAARGLPADDAHSWHFGLKRMLLGVAMTERSGRLFDDTLPFDAIEGVRAQILGKLLGFMEALEAAMNELAGNRSVADWAALLPALCERFCLDARMAAADVAGQRAAQALRGALLAMARAATAADCAIAVPLPVIRRELDANLEATPPAWAFLGGGVTFAALRAYRAVPARVICLIGINDGLFPRNPAMPGFDLMNKHPRPGDRDLRAEDRHAFFDALLSAREILHVSYAGRSIRDNTALPPSMLVAELRDAIDAMAVAPDDKSATDALTIHHRLQPFSPRYFDGGDVKLYSHAQHYATAAEAARNASEEEAQPFLTKPLAEDADELLDVSPRQFMRFFRNPAEYLLRHRLGIHLEESDGLLETVEPFVPDGLERHRLRTQLVEDWQAGLRDPDAARALARARGMLPHGTAGTVWFDGMWAEFAPFARSITDQGGAALPPQRIDLTAAGVHVEGSISKLQQLPESGGGGIVRLDWRVGELRAADQLDLWLNHLLLHAAGIACTSVFMTSTKSLHLLPLNSVDIETLFALYRRGCRELLPFFPATSLNWLMAQRSGKQSNWRKEWDAGLHSFSAEKQNPYVALAWDGCDPFDLEFEILAAHVYAGLLEHVEAEQEDAE